MQSPALGVKMTIGTLRSGVPTRSARSAANGWIVPTGRSLRENDRT
jgi:hypothetical protein